MTPAKWGCMEKFISNFEDKYTVTNKGEVFSFNNGKKVPLSLVLGKRGYFVVSLSSSNKAKQYRVHRLVAEAFIPNPQQKPCVNHKDGNKQNNCVENLEWVTYGENKHHSFVVLGERHWMQDKLGKLCIHHKVVEQIDPSNGKVVARYYGAQEAHRVTGFSQGNISSVCRKQRRIANGFYWRYANDGRQMG